MRYLALLYLALLAIPAFSQKNEWFQPAPCVTQDSAKLIAHFSHRTETYLSTLPRNPDKAYINFYKGRFDYELLSLKRGNFLFAPNLEAYINNILEEIFRANPDIPSSDIRLFISRMPEPNASSLGDGVLLFNIGLLSRLENESQVAFILCHEIAHFKLNHSEISLRKTLETLETQNTARKLDKISKSETGAYRKAAELLQAVVYEDRRNSRKHEWEADELGLKYLLNTRYDAREALKCMKILETIDDPKYPDSLNLRLCFNTSSYPFKQEWLKTESSSMGFSESAIEKSDLFNQDSVNTHPDCPARFKAMEKMLSGYVAQNKFINYQTDIHFADLAKQADFEIVESYFHFNIAGDCLYESLKLLKQYPDDPYLQGKIAISLYVLNKALATHDLDKHLPQPSSAQTPDYRAFVQFIHKLRSRELAKLGYFYLNDKPDIPKTNEDVLCALALVAKMAEKPEEYAQYKAQYMSAFPKGRYLHLLNDK